MASIAAIMMGVIANALTFSKSNYMSSKISKKSMKKNERDTIKLWKICKELK